MIFLHLNFPKFNHSFFCGHYDTIFYWVWFCFAGSSLPVSQFVSFLDPVPCLLNSLLLSSIAHHCGSLWETLSAVEIQSGTWSLQRVSGKRWDVSWFLEYGKSGPDKVSGIKIEAVCINFYLILLSIPAALYKRNVFL